MAAYGFYLLVVGVFATLIVVSVVKSVLSMTPTKPAPAREALSLVQCVERTQALLDELEKRRQALTQAASVRRVDQEWTHFRVEWLQREGQLESQCDAHTQGRKALGQAFEQLEKLMDLYTTHAVQFAGEVGPTLDGVRAAIESARNGGSAP